MAVDPGMTDADVLAYFSKLSNWGRWGSADQLGTINLISDEVRLNAAGLVRTGKAVGCSRTLSPKRSAENEDPVLHHMIVSGEGAPDKGFGAASDWFGMSFHGYAITHVDALSHLFWDGRMYNDRPADVVKTATGARVGSVELARHGIVSRGVLLDIPRHRGVGWLDLGEAIGPDELLACAGDQDVELRSGDILLVRVGRDPRTAERGPSHPERDGTPGLHASCLPLLHDRGIAMLGADATNDVMPSGFDRVQVPIHSIGMVAIGLWLLDNAYLEDLASACSDARRWEFLMSINPLMLKNATGSPVNPVAVL